MTFSVRDTVVRVCMCVMCIVDDQSKGKKRGHKRHLHKRKKKKEIFDINLQKKDNRLQVNIIHSYTDMHRVGR